MKPPLTPTESRVYEFMLSHQRKHARPPSLREIQDKFGYAGHAAARKHLLAMKEKGWAKQTGEGKPYAAVDVDNPAKAAVRVPVYDALIGKWDDPVFSVRIDRNFFYLRGNVDSKLYGVLVNDDTMFAAGLESGDVALVCPGDAIENDIVVYRTNGTRKIRRLERKGGKWFYRAESMDLNEIPYIEHDAIVVGVLRRARNPGRSIT